MPILNHFHPPLAQQRLWHAFHNAWAATMARHLNRFILPEAYFAAPNVQFGARLDIDLGTFATSPAPYDAVDSTVALSAPPEPATLTVPAIFPDTIEVLIVQQEGGPQLVAALELVSPSNKDRPQSRLAFAAKMATYLHQGMALGVIDLVTSRAANLHNAWIALLGLSAGHMPEPSDSPLYANTYRPVQRHGQAEIDLWLHALRLGVCLPDIPLFLRADLCVTLPLETTYVETCQDQRITLP